MKSYEESVSSRIQSVAAQAQDRRKVLRQTGNFNKGLQMMTAKLLQNSIELLVSMMRRGREDMRQKKRMISETGGKLEAAMETEQFKVLKGIMDSDKKLDEMIEKNQKRDEWQKKTVTEGVAFRDKVAAVVDSLGGSLGTELALLRSQ